MKLTYFTFRIIFVIFIGVMVSHPAANSQGGYKHIFSIVEDFNSLNLDDILYHEDRLYVRGNAYVDSANIWGLFIACLDTNGVLLWHNSIYDTTRSSHYIANTPTRFWFAENGNIIVPNKIFNRNKLALTMLDPFGKELWTREYPHTGKTIYPFDVREQDGDLYMFGLVQRENFLVDNYVLRTDSNGVMKWIKYIGSAQHDDFYGDVIQNTDGTFTVSSDRSTNGYLVSAPIMGWKKPWIFTIDTSGTIVDQWLGEENDTRTLGGGSFYHADNGDWIIISKDVKTVLYHNVHERRVSPTITRLNNEYELLWKLSLTNYANLFDRLVDMEYDPIRDEFIAAGQKQIWYDEGPETEIWFVKVNGDGEVIWNITDTVYYKFPGGELHYTGGIALSPSGSIYAAGYVRTYRDEGWILKVTPDGCTDTLCSTTSIIDQIRKQKLKQTLHIYPNPAIDEIHVNITTLSGVADMNIYDVNGNVVHQTKIWEGDNRTSLSLRPGIYLYTVVLDGQMIHSGKVVIM